MELVCYYCYRVMKKMKSGLVVSDYPSDRENPTVQRGDLFECPDCGIQMIGSFGDRHIRRNKSEIIWVD